MLLVAVMEPDIADSLPHIGDEHWVRFYVILSANGALAFLVRKCEMTRGFCTWNWERLDSLLQNQEPAPMSLLFWK